MAGVIRCAHTQFVKGACVNFRNLIACSLGQGAFSYMHYLMTFSALKDLTSPRRRRELLLAACLSLLLVLPAAGSGAGGAQAVGSCDVPNFKAATRFSAGKNPRGIAVADFNGDGRLDVAVANAGSSDGTNDGSVLILLGDAGALLQASVNAN